MFNINVKNGTNAGWKTLKPARKNWYCAFCERGVAKHWVKCPDCGTEAPERG